MPVIDFASLTADAQKLVRRWVSALRSGEYQQTDSALKKVWCYGDNDEQTAYCCLGVLCDLVDPNRWTGLSYLGAGGDADWYDTYPPDDVVQPLGLATMVDGANEYDAANDVYHILAGYNDRGASFEEIADKIEEYYGLKDPAPATDAVTK